MAPQQSLKNEKLFQRFVSMKRASTCIYYSMIMLVKTDFSFMASNLFDTFDIKYNLLDAYRL